MHSRAKHRRRLALPLAATLTILLTTFIARPASAANTVFRSLAVQGGTNSVAVDLFASEVETLGVEHFPATFAGATLEPTGVTDVYAVAASDAKLVGAIKTLDKHEYPVKVVAVGRSYSQLMSISAKLQRAYSHLRAKGINLTQWGPDPASGTVDVTLRKPTASGMSALGSAEGTPVASSNYRAEASAVLKQQAGAGITLQSRYATSLPFLAGRDDDIAPFYDGDQIYDVRAGETCTSGFNMSDAFGNAYMVTAGHCRSGTWKTHAATIGNTIQNYLTATSLNDFQYTNLNGGGLAYVWTDGFNIAPVTGALFPAVGAAITFNGSVTLEVRGVTVNHTSVSQCFFDRATQTTVCASNLTEATKDGATVCQEGDSGGPVYSHTPQSNVLAIGIIEGGDGPTCYATQIDHIAFITGLSLLTTSP